MGKVDKRSSVAFFRWSRVEEMQGDEKDCTARYQVFFDNRSYVTSHVFCGS